MGHSEWLGANVGSVTNVDFMSPADSLFSKFKSVQSWSGGCDPRSIMITVTELQNNSAPTRKSGTPALSEPGLSALFWSTVLSGAQIFFSTFFCVQNHRTR